MVLYKYVVGGFSVTKSTLLRVFSAHICLAFIIVGISVVHLFYLHLGGSNNPLFVRGGYSDIVLFHRFFTVKDGLFVLFFFFFLTFFMFVFPELVLDVESYIEANPLVTPVSIKPEWYFLAFYAMLRSIESKVGGLVLVLCFLLVLWLPTLNKCSSYRFVRQFIFWCIVCLFILLRFLGSCHPEYPYVFIRKIGSIFIVLLVSLYKGL